MSSIYDTVIIGGGMAGLYLNYKILKNNRNKKTVLIEKNNWLGGRVYTHHEKVRNKHYSMEAGAGRFNKNHKLLLKLIKEFGLEKKVMLLSNKYNLALTKKKWKESTLSNYLPYQLLDALLKKIKLTDKQRNISFEEFLKSTVSTSIFKYIKDTYPYSDIFKINAYDAIFLYKRDLNINNEFFILIGGLSQIVNILENKIKKYGGKIIKNCSFKSYKEIEKKVFLVKTSNCNFLTKSLVFAVQRPTLNKVEQFKKINFLTNSVMNISLNRIYAIFPTNKCAWFKNIPKTISDSKLSYFIPINEKNGLVMISYTDDEKAKYFKKFSEKNNDKMIDFLVDECKKMFGINNIPKPIWWKTCFWKNGVADWKPKYNSKKVSKKIIKPFNNKKVFICGENYSEKFQCWIEGALETAESVFKILNY